MGVCGVVLSIVNNIPNFTSILLYWPNLAWQNYQRIFAEVSFQTSGFSTLLKANEGKAGLPA